MTGLKTTYREHYTAAAASAIVEVPIRPYLTI